MFNDEFLEILKLCLMMVSFYCTCYFWYRTMCLREYIDFLRDSLEKYRDVSGIDVVEDHLEKRSADDEL